MASRSQARTCSPTTFDAVDTNCQERLCCRGCGTSPLLQPINTQSFGAKDSNLTSAAFLLRLWLYTPCLPRPPALSLCLSQTKAARPTTLLNPVLMSARPITTKKSSLLLRAAIQPRAAGRSQARSCSNSPGPSSACMRTTHTVSRHFEILAHSSRCNLSA